MNLTIKLVRSASCDEWDAIWKECDYSTYFHSREWAEIWSAYTRGGLQPDPKIILFSDGLQALLPLSSHKGRLFTRYFSSPGGTFGGWLSLDSLSISHKNLLINFCVKELKNLFLRINPYDEDLSELSLSSFQYDETQTLELGRVFQSIFKEWSKGHRSAVHKAERAGISIYVASNHKEWEDYFNLYQESLKRWGDKATSSYRIDIFLDMFQRNSPYIKLWLAMYEGKVVAGALCFYSKRHVVYWHGAGLEEHFDIRPVNLLLYKAIEDACKTGYLWFDFNPSGGHEGVKAFKKSFGTKPKACPYFQNESRFFMFLEKCVNMLRKALK